MDGIPRQEREAGRSVPVYVQEIEDGEVAGQFGAVVGAAEVVQGDLEGLEGPKAEEARGSEECLPLLCHVQAELP